MATNRYALAAGHDNAGGLVFIQNLVSFEGEGFAEPRIYGSYDPGTIKIRGDGMLHFSGFGMTAWQHDFITWEKDFYLRATFANGGYSGPVTLKTRADDPYVFPVFNAVVHFPKLSELRSKFGIFEDYVVKYTRMKRL